jgi:hypothetical protein
MGYQIVTTFATPLGGAVHILAKRLVNYGHTDIYYAWEHVDLNGEPVSREEDFGTETRMFTSLVEYLVGYIGEKK